ncbi:HOMODA hydrolase [Solimonas aquatica]|uniref:HOMODA hydrolase n=1 Tax=Solimonas aquatica TaxID=489703 RepID=A0A1H9BG51_9GAMM|nr:HOMODA hydrolase [Solimonas aquatica]
MSLWLDLLGVEIRYVDTPSYGRIRVAEAGRKDAPAIIFQHGIGGHLEAYCKNLLPLSDQFRCIAFDYVGHALSARKSMEYTPVTLAEQLRELLDALGLERVHLSGESLGGWVSGFFAARYPHRTMRLMLNTAAGIPIVSDKGLADMQDLMERSRKAAGSAPTYESVRHRIEWLIHPCHHDLISDELVRLRLHYYRMPEGLEVSPMVNRMLARHDEFLLPLEQIQADTLLLWTRDNPIHDLDCAKAALPRLPRGRLYVMEADSAHWPQYEAPEEFNTVARSFFGAAS